MRESVVRRNRAVPWLLISPVQILLIVVILLPTLSTTWLSFFSYGIGKPFHYVGAKNYITLFTDPIFLHDLLNNVIFVNVVVYGELLLGIGFAVFFNRRLPFKRFLVSLVMAPYAVSTVLGVLMWQFMLQPDIGLLNGALRSLHLPQLEWTVNPGDAMAVYILLSIWLNVPFTFLILYNSLLGISTELVEAARIDGASSFQVFRHIRIPLIMPAILVALIFRYIFAFRTFDVVWILSEGGPYRSTELLSIYLYKVGFTYFEFGLASAVAWVMVLVTILLGAYYFRSMYKRMF